MTIEKAIKRELINGLLDQFYISLQLIRRTISQIEMINDSEYHYTFASMCRELKYIILALEKEHPEINNGGKK